MLKLIFFSMLLISCESEQIRECGKACKKTGVNMSSWSKDIGCVCGTIPNKCLEVLIQE